MFDRLLLRVGHIYVLALPTLPPDDNKINTNLKSLFVPWRHMHENLPIQ